MAQVGTSGNGMSMDANISADGRWITSDGITRFIADGSAPTISPDGRWIGFLSSSSDLVSGDAIYAQLYDWQTDEITVIGGYAEEIHGRASNVVNFSMDGEWLAFSSVAHK